MKLLKFPEIKIEEERTEPDQLIIDFVHWCLMDDSEQQEGFTKMREAMFDYYAKIQ